MKKYFNGTFGELYLAVEKGEEFYLYKDEKIFLQGVYLHTRNNCQEYLGRALARGEIYQKAEWWEQLDGTEENGVWCLIQGYGGNLRICKMTKYEDGHCSSNALGSIPVNELKPLSGDLMKQILEVAND